MIIGAQLYTVRESTQDLESFSETLKKVADIGYTSVQVSGTCAFDAQWLADELRCNGLICPVTHTQPERVAGETEAVINEHKVFGCGIAGIGGAPGLWEFSKFDYPGFRDRFLPAADKYRAAGMKMGYHNHHIEFNRVNGSNMLEKLAADFPADSLTFILDTYWIQYAGGDSAAWIEKLSGRVHCVHLKDFAIADTEQRMAPVGEGNINFDSVLAACESAGTEYLLVEQDNCYEDDAFDCLKRSYLYLRAKGLK